MKSSPLFTALVLMAGTLISQPLLAQENPQIGNVIIEGQKQGTFKTQGKDNEALQFIGFNFDVQATRDAGSGLPTGKKKYMPITLTRYSDAASVNIFEAVSTNEDLKLVTIQLIRRSPEGKTQVYETIKLQNATVSSYVQYEGTGAPIRYGTNTTPVEEIQFTFQKISWQMVDSKTTATDDWLAGQ